MKPLFTGTLSRLIMAGGPHFQHGAEFMWLRNLFFVAVCFAGVGALAFSLAPRTVPTVRIEHAVSRGDVDFRATAADVDAAFQKGWRERGLTPAAPADPLTIARRVNLALCGTIPSLEELRLLEERPAAEQVDWWLAGTLADRRAADYLAERYARAFVGVENEPFLVFRRHRFVAWLAERFERGAPYDGTVRDLIADEGLWTDNPGVNFLTATINAMQNKHPDPNALAARTARAFLGLRIDCAECHDHPFEHWKQSDFEGLAAFYGGVENQNVRGLRDAARPYVVEDRKTGEKRTVAPCVPFNAELFADPGRRRAALAAWVTHPQNKLFGRAAANRAWAVMFGRPLVEPVDDVELSDDATMTLERTVLDRLADDFVQHRYDLRRLLRLIASTEVFRLDSRVPNDDATPAHEQAWAVFPLTRLRPEQTIGGILQASSAATLDAESTVAMRLVRYFQEEDFVRRYGDAGEDEFTPTGGTIPQRLLMMNGRLVREKLNDPLIFNAASRIATLASSDGAAVEAAYLAVLTRRPTPRELEYFTAQMAQPRGPGRRAVVEDLFWTLFNSTEFAWNH